MKKLIYVVYAYFKLIYICLIHLAAFIYVKSTDRKVVESVDTEQQALLNLIEAMEYRSRELRQKAIDIPEKAGMYNLQASRLDLQIEQKRKKVRKCL